jgi:magnesium and cobalt transporter
MPIATTASRQLCPSTLLTSATDVKTHRSLFERLTALISPEPENRAELLEVLHDAHERNLIDADALSMIEGVFQVSDLSVRDIMVPRSQMDVIDITKPIEEWLPIVLETAHSRFPAIEGERDKVVGILLAKDLLRYYAEESFDVRDMLRPAIFIPESKRLNVLLRDFRANHNHMAIVVDEYSGVAGLITIEDVLEQIVGDIEDEYDFDEEEDNILSIKEGQHGPRWRVKALTEIDQFNEEIGVDLPEDDVDTIGGLVASHLGRMPHKGEVFDLDNLRFEVLRADARQIHVLLVEKLPARRRTRLTRVLTDDPEPAGRRRIGPKLDPARRPARTRRCAAPVPASPSSPGRPGRGPQPVFLRTLRLVAAAVPVLAYLFYQVGMGSSTRRATLLGWAFGFGWSVAGMHWLYIALNRFGGLPAPVAASPSPCSACTWACSAPSPPAPPPGCESAGRCPFPPSCCWCSPSAGACRNGCAAGSLPVFPGPLPAMRMTPRRWPASRRSWACTASACWWPCAPPAW